ncbi:MAG: hypothetical protein AAF501_09815 [Pseudomonadota bacterium]
MTAPIRQADVNAASDMFDRVEETFSICSKRVFDDGAYGIVVRLGRREHKNGIVSGAPRSVVEHVQKWRLKSFRRIAIRHDGRDDTVLSAIASPLASYADYEPGA